MPKWEKEGWKGGRVYLDADGKKVFVIERRAARITGVPGSTKRYSIRLKTHDEDLAVGELARFLADPVGFTMASAPKPPPAERSVFITKERITLYMESIKDTVEDHRAARFSYLKAWGKLELDLHTVDRATLRKALATFKGGHRGRTEALNAFANFLVAEKELEKWDRLVNKTEPKHTRAERVVYTKEELQRVYAGLTSQRMRDVFRLRVETGMHFTEIAQLEGAPMITGPLNDKGVAIRVLPEGHEIRGVLQVMHKSQNRHRQPVHAAGLAAALRLRESVPSRISVWEAFKPLVPSNLRHTFATLGEEIGKTVAYQAGGIDPIQIQRSMGHAVGSNMLRDRYSKVQVPKMSWLPLGLEHKDDPPLKA